MNVSRLWIGSLACVTTVALTWLGTRTPVEELDMSVETGEPRITRAGPQAMGDAAAPTGVGKEHVEHDSPAAAHAVTRKNTNPPDPRIGGSSIRGRLRGAWRRGDLILCRRPRDLPSAVRVGRDDGFSFEQLDEGEVCALEYRGKGGFLRARAVVVATRATGNTVYLSIEPWKHLDLVLSNDIGGDVVWAFVHRPCAPEKAVGPELRVQRAVAIGPRALRVDRLRQDVVSGKLWTAGGFYARLWNVVVSRTDAATETPVRFEKPGQLVVRARTLPEGPLRVHVADASYETKQRRLRRPRRLRGLAEAAIRTRTGALTRDGSCTFNHMWAISYDVFVIDDAGLVLDHKTCRVAPATTTTCYVLESGGRGRLILKARAPVKFRVVSASQGTVAAGVIEAGKVRDLGWLPRDRYQAWWGGARPGRIEFELGQDRRTEIVLPGR